MNSKIIMLASGRVDVRRDWPLNHNTSSTNIRVMYCACLSSVAVEIMAVCRKWEIVNRLKNEVSELCDVYILVSWFLCLSKNVGLYIKTLGKLQQNMTSDFLIGKLED